MNSCPEPSDFGARVPANSLSHSAATCCGGDDRAEGHGALTEQFQQPRAGGRDPWAGLPSPLSPSLSSALAGGPMASPSTVHPLQLATPAWLALTLPDLLELFPKGLE